MGNEIPVGATSLEYRGLVIQFCCPQCDETFKENPEETLTAAAEKKQTVAISLFDPVSQHRLPLEEAKTTASYGGIVWPFTSEEEKETFLALPEVYASAPDQEALFCPVLKNEVSAYSQASGYADYEGVRYYFCCAGCDVKFLEDPESYIGNAADKVRAVGWADPGKTKKKRSLAPTCAGCAGEARMLVNGELGSAWTFSYRSINIDEPEARHRYTLDYRLTPRLSVGLETAGGDSSVLPRGTWFITPEGEHHPSLVLGLASDRLSTPRGSALFLTASKSIADLPVLPFVSVKYNTDDGKVFFPFGANWMVDDRHTLQVINDGRSTHLLLTRFEEQFNFSLILARMKHLGFSVNVAF